MLNRVKKCSSTLSVFASIGCGLLETAAVYDLFDKLAKLIADESFEEEIGASTESRLVFVGLVLPITSYLSYRFFQNRQVVQKEKALLKQEIAELKEERESTKLRLDALEKKFLTNSEPRLSSSVFQPPVSSPVSNEHAIEVQESTEMMDKKLLPFQLS